MNLFELDKLSRRGSIFPEDADVLQGIFELGQTVDREGDLEWRARSPEAAAAWLLLLAHLNACSDERIPSCKFIPPAKNVLLVFRGQAGKYTSLLPSIYRAGKDRAFEWRASEWLHTVLQLWLGEGFKWAVEPHTNFILGSRDATAIAQHYGVGTIVTDWTWDPLNALSFAIQGEREGSEGIILFDTLAKESENLVLLPPTFARRVWKQRGVFRWFYTPPEGFDDWSIKQHGLDDFLKARASVSNYTRVTFPIDERSVGWARDRYLTLMTDEGPLKEFTDWAVNAAGQTGIRPPYSLSNLSRADDFDKTIGELGLALPDSLNRSRAEPVFEDIETTLEYCDAMSLRKRGEQWGYDLGALIVFGEGLGGGNSVCRNLEESEPDPRLRIIGPVAKQPYRERCRISGGNPMQRYYEKKNVRWWYEDEWEDVDLFRPLES